MDADEEGFLYPCINESKCVNCGLCEKVCPVLSGKKVKDSPIAAYVVRAKEKEILKHSTSGGFVTPVAGWVLCNEGVLCAASYDKKFGVSHVIREKIAGGVLGLLRLEVLSMSRAA